MVVNENNNNTSLSSLDANSKTTPDLLDFSINLYNIEKYLAAGQHNEILKYTNISAPVLLRLDNKDGVLRNDKLMLHVLQNCSTYGFATYWKFLSFEILKKIFEIEKPSPCRFRWIMSGLDDNNYKRCFWIIEYFLEIDREEKIVEGFCLGVFREYFLKLDNKPGYIFSEGYKKNICSILTELIDILNKYEVINKYFENYNFGNVNSEQKLIISKINLTNPKFNDQTLTVCSIM